jgi:predicted transposase YdaD
MAIKFYEEDDLYYIAGKKRGIEKGLEIGIKGGIEIKQDCLIFALIRSEKMTLEDIAVTADVSLEYVQKLAEQLKKSAPQSLNSKIKDLKFVMLGDLLYVRGLEKGMEAGMDEGIEKGIEKKQNNMIIALIEKGKLTLSEIAEITEVSLVYVQNLAEQLKK